MIEKFKSSTHFRTYQVERNPSFSANCNVLLALVHSGSIEQHSTLIEHTVTFLLSQWASGKTSDKWNLSPYYSYMLLSDVLLCLLEQRNEGHLQRLHKNITEHKIPICLCQVVFKTLNSQHEDGSWSHCVEETSYCIIILARCLSLPWEPDLKQGIVKSRDRAMRFISTAQIGDQESGYLWVEKVTYGSSVLRRVYYLTALGFPVEQPEWCDQIRRSFGASKCYTRSMHLLFSEMPLLKKSALHFVGLAFVEASRLAERLTEMRRIVFPRDDMPMTEDKYLSYIPIIWTICNHVGGGVLSSETLWRMILLSMLNYQVDEYMETIVPRLSTSNLNELISHIRKNCGLGSSRGHNSSLDLLPFANTINSSRKRPYDELDDQCNVFTVTGSYMNFVLKHPAVISAPSVTQKELVVELYNFLIAHITQNIDNKVLKASKEPERNLNGTSEPEYSQKNYFKWVHSTAADSTSCPFSFHFFTSLICDTGRSFFDGPRAKYLGQSLTRHLATMCRQYNDCGSAARDNEETNLNSLDFPDFQEGPGRTSNGTGQVETPEQLAEEERREVESTSLMHSKQTMKDKLIGLADFERAQMELAFKELDKAMRSSPTKVQALRVFVNVTDLFGQIYVQKDIASRVKASR